jgi:glycerol-3-phosphate dehydrogenase (NAD(P)+)
MSKKIRVLGGGAWGQALAEVARDAGHDVAVWSRTAPEQRLAETAEAIIIAVPAQAVRHVLSAVPVPAAAAIIISAKGIERGSGAFMHEVVKAAAPANPALILSGPSFAADVLAGKPTAVTLGAATLAQANDWAAALSLPHFRIYGSDDVMGVALGGAMKNVLAIACGISDGRQLGDSARAALITRSFAELSRFGKAMGARPDTLMGLSGLGDLLLTCTSPQSRNYSAGHRIGRGASARDAIAATPGTVEGAHTAQVAVDLARRHGIDMPIITAVHAILDEGSSPEDEINRLLARPLKSEI